MGRVRNRAVTSKLRVKIGVMGTSDGYVSRKNKEMAYQLGRAIARNNCIIITGACPGIPHAAVKGAKEGGGLSVGISPASNLREHIGVYKSPFKEYDIIIFTGTGFMGRETTTIRSCDIAVFAGGRSGTLGEFAIAWDEAKLIGALLGTGGITDRMDDLVGMVNKRTGTKVVAHSDPEILIKELLNKFDE